MRISIRWGIVCLLAANVVSPAFAGKPPVSVTIETTLSTASAQIRQFAFDGDANTFFASEKSRC